MLLEASADPLSSHRNFQTEFIRSMIEDALEDFQDRMRHDIFNLQVEMLRQFQIQQVGGPAVFLFLGRIQVGTDHCLYISISFILIYGSYES
jgi:hypothetical protein